MNKLLLLFAPFLLLSCSALRKADIPVRERTQFAELQLEPRADIFYYRLDIIRQQRSEYVNDSTSNTVDVEYHTMGFDLGNGLFFDLHDNLGIDLFQLLEVDTSKSFMISTASFKNNGQKRRK